jgi:hypothetical protein
MRPAAVAKAADALVSGAVMGLKLQPFEAHIPYLLQFKIDMNLYGMSHLLCRVVSFRRDPPQQARTRAAPGWQHEVTRATRLLASGEQPSQAARFPAELPLHLQTLCKTSQCFFAQAPHCLQFLLDVYERAQSSHALLS